MYTEQFQERHKKGVVRFTGSNRGLLYTNERQVEVEQAPQEEGGETAIVTMWEYDVYEVEDARFPGSAKNQTIESEHPFGDETKILRKTLAKVLKKLSEYDSSDYEEFKRYNEFCEGITANTIAGSVIADDPTEEELLAQAKAKKLDQIAQYDSSANVNAFTVNGVIMWLNFDERSRLKASLEAAIATGEATMVKFFAGMRFEYPVATWQQMIIAVENYAGQCLNVSDTHMANVTEMDNIADVENYDYRVNYPPKLEFS